MKLAVVTAGLSVPSSTRLLADRLAAATVAAAGEPVDVSVVELRDIALDVTKNLLTGFPAPALRSAIETVTGADALVAVTPVFTAGYSGLFKSFFDVLDADSLVGKPVLLGATGGTERHSLVLDYQLRPLFAYLKADPVATGVYAASSDWGSGEGALQRRIDKAGAELAALAAGRPAVPAGPDFVPFDRLLAEVSTQDG
ncbi:CE1759 family FMN reductase [Amycolatopsis australiensis]|uniref:FMN reductase n=1 Tax=Amycolatopsis australiensis TaxID=546364 RepID=A0A1K1T8D5_9PSEU|nr:CE1759 family FMN reductase [Amycolatopsis australiensis]SFW92285.1 FMN reductase [Amycolatopsis australiensis]